MVTRIAHHGSNGPFILFNNETYRPLNRETNVHDNEYVGVRKGAKPDQLYVYRRVTDRGSPAFLDTRSEVWSTKK